MCLYKHFHFKLLYVGLALIICSCNTTKQLRDGEYLVSKNTIQGHQKSKIEKSDIEPYIRQKPNRKVLSILPFNVWLYGKIDKEKLIRHKEKRDAKFDRINLKRIEKNRIKNEKRVKQGKPTKLPRLKNKDKATFRESLLEISEEPVIYDSLIAKQSAQQIKRYLFSKGYFYAKVSDSVFFRPREKKANVFYKLQPGSQYFIKSVSYLVNESELAHFIFQDTIHSLIKPGKPFDTEILTAERERIANYLQNNGYYFFEPDFVFYEIDSTLNNKKINITINFKDFPEFLRSDDDSVSFVKHPRFNINNIYVITETIKGSYKDQNFRDTIKYDEYLFLIKDKVKFRLSVIADNIEFYKGQMFQKALAEKTYKRILNLGVFRNVLIQFVKNTAYQNKLDCYIICQPLIRQSVTIETEGTNTSGNLGIDGSLLFQNKNLLKGAELLEFSLNGALIAQQQFNDKQGAFNTVQIGPAIRYSVPRAAFPFSMFPFKKDAAPRTFINSSLNYQSRPEFNRFITTVNYGFSFKTKKGKLRQDIIPIEIYMVQAKLSDNFKANLKALNDFFLLNSFQDHITTVSRYTIVYNSQMQSALNTSKKPVGYIRINLASSGNLLRAGFQASDVKPDSLNRYLINKIPFAQFVKSDFEFRFYIPIRQRSRAVYRTLLGIGKPLINLGVLPYEQSYFSGGPNSVRAWRARTLGPGGYDPTNTNSKYDKIGDLILEANVEYRFHIFRSFYGAWFVDVGNIWLLHEDPLKPKGDFEINRFYKEFAVGSGWGIRWDLNFFVLRLDAAIPLADPKYPEGQRWTFDKKPLRQFTLNFGIGYPF